VALGLVAIAVAAGYLFWFRDSSLVRVERVNVTGIGSSSDLARVRAKLTVAAHGMTTLHVNESALRQAVADEPIVHSITVQAQFPHRLAVSIVENRPVAMLVAGSRQVPVAPDGTLLVGAKVSGGGLPAVRIGFVPSRGRLPEGQARQLVEVAAAAPPRLLSLVSSITIEHGRGAVAQLQTGPPIYFGRASALAAKWAAAAGVLAQSSSQGASFIDVRMPERPVAGGLGLTSDPQPGVQAPPAGASTGSPGIVPANPGGTAATPGTTPGTALQTQPATPVTPSQTAPPATAAQVPAGPTNAQP
jgi:cell division protein FtsQ